MIFVDTGALFALLVATDANHAKALTWHKAAPRDLVTTDHVVFELLTLLRAKGHNHKAIAVGRRLFAGELVRLERAGPDDIQAAWRIFQQFHDKRWSFTDCVSRTVMERLDIREAFAFDEHFRQFGIVTVVP